MTHGPDAVRALVEESDLSYPVSLRRLEREYALENVELDAAGNSVMLVELLGEVDNDTFENEQDLVETLEPLFEEHRRERNGGLVARLKRLFLSRSG